MARRDDVLVSRTYYQVGIVTLLASLIWVVVGINSATGKEFKIEVDPTYLAPINPSIDQETIKALTGRLKVEVDLNVSQESSTSATVSATINTGGL